MTKKTRDNIKQAIANVELEGKKMDNDMKELLYTSIENNLSTKDIIEILKKMR